ncbi:MAG: hypothetical protein HYY76_12055 [Acidobacteria bacterium]|nr:hypothetical protein [Acidobacteriota bacterium]
MAISRAPARRRRAPRLRRGIGALGFLGLTLLGLAYWLTYEPAPRVRVLWRPDLTAEQRAALEEKYLLLNRRDRLPEGSLAYDLLDTSPRNLRALVDDPAILDTNDIERHALVVVFDVDYGREWMWIAHRTPWLRDRRTRNVLILVLALMAIGGLAPDGARTWSAARHRAHVHRKQG